MNFEMIKKHLAEPQEIELGDDKINIGIVPIELSYKLFFLQDKIMRILREAKTALENQDENFVPTIELDMNDYNNSIEIIKSCILSANPDFPKEHIDNFIISNYYTLFNGVLKIHTFGIEKAIKIKEMLDGHKGDNIKTEEKKDEEKWLIKVHHRLMKEYGWIPFDEFKKLPIITIMNLMDEIMEDKKNPEWIPVVIMGMSKKGRR